MRENLQSDTDGQLDDRKYKAIPMYPFISVVGG